MQFNAYGGNGAALAAAMVNFGDYRPGPLIGLLTEYEILRPEVTSAQAGELREWAARLEPVFGLPDLPRQVGLVNELLDLAASRPRVSTHDGLPPHLHYVAPQAGVVSRVRAVTASGLAMAVCFSDGGRLGRCERRGCGVVYVDTSRNGRRRFCSLRCANRVNVAAHRARAAGSGPASR